MRKLAGLAALLLFLSAFNTVKPVSVNADDHPKQIRTDLAQLYNSAGHLRLNGNPTLTKDTTLRIGASVLFLIEGRMYPVSTDSGGSAGWLFLGQGRVDVMFPQEQAVGLERAGLRALAGGAWHHEFTRALLLGSTPFPIPTRGDLPAPASSGEETAVLARLAQQVTQVWRRDFALRLLSEQLNPTGNGFQWVLLGGKDGKSFALGHDALGLVPDLLGSEPDGLLLLGDGDPRTLSLAGVVPEKSFGKDDPGSAMDYDLLHMGLDVNITAGGTIRALASARMESRRDRLRLIRFALDPRLRVSACVLVRAGTDSAAIPQGVQENLEFVQGPSIGESGFAVLLSAPAAKGEIVELLCQYEGSGLLSERTFGSFQLDAGSLGRWYPRNWLADFGDSAIFEARFSLPARWRLAFSGELLERNEIAGTEITRWTSRVPIPTAGFMYGNGEVAESKLKDLSLIGYLPASQRPDPDDLAVRRGDDISSAVPAMNSAAQVRAEVENSLARVGAAHALFTDLFGPNGFNVIAAGFSDPQEAPQSWPMLIRIPRQPDDRSAHPSRTGWNPAGVTAADLAMAHEVAHQWWGHRVAWKTYHDEWLAEGLSEFASSLYLELAANGDPKARREALSAYWKRRREALTAGEKGAARASRALASLGPLALGMRLNDLESGTYQSLVYPKGAFVLHMLRKMMMEPQAAPERRDSRFFSMLKAFFTAFEGRCASTSDFQGVVERYMTPGMDLDGQGKLDWFFREWWEGTEVPHYDLAYSITPIAQGFTVRFRVHQRAVGPLFKMLVPVYAEFKGGEVRRIGIAQIRGSGLVESEVQLPTRPLRLILCAEEDVLCTKTERATS